MENSRIGPGAFAIVLLTDSQEVPVRLGFTDLPGFLCCELLDTNGKPWRARLFPHHLVRQVDIVPENEAAVFAAHPRHHLPLPPPRK